MSTVKEIAERIAREESGLPEKAGWPTETVPRQDKKSLMPNRKVWAAAVAGVVAVISAYLSQTQGYELDEAGTTAVTMMLMTLVAYFVPEPE